MDFLVSIPAVIFFLANPLTFTRDIEDISAMVAARV